MTHLELRSVLLLAGWGMSEYDPDGLSDDLYRMNIFGKMVEVYLDKRFPPLWRYTEVYVPYDIGLIVDTYGVSHILYEGERPNSKTWTHYEMFGNPEQAWEFILAFLQKHP